MQDINLNFKKRVFILKLAQLFFLILHFLQKTNSQICQNGFYPNLETLDCSPCNPECFNCFGPGNSCYLCQQNYYLLDSSCLLDCPDYHFKDEETQLCKKCIDNCIQCSDENTCMQCNQNFIYDTAFQMCKSRCENGMVLDMKTNQCKFVCGENEMENKISKYCQKIIDCSQIDRLSLDIFQDGDITGILFNNIHGHYITYDSQGKLLIWEQSRRLLIKELAFHTNKIINAFFIQFKGDLFLVSYDSLNAVMWHYQSGQIQFKVSIGQNIIIGSSISLQWQAVILKNYNNQYFIRDLMRALSFTLDCSELDPESIELSVKDVIPLLYDKYGKVRIYDPVAIFNNLQQNQQLNTFLELNFMNITDPLDFRIVDTTLTRFVYTFNKGIQIFSINKQSNSINSCETLLTQYQFINLFLVKQDLQQNQLIFQFVGFLTQNIFLKFKINSNTLNVMELIEINSYSNQSILKVYLISNYQISKQVSQQYICLVEQNSVILLNYDLQSILQEFQISKQNNLKVQMNNDFLFIYSNYLEVYDINGRELYNIQPDLISEKQLFPVLHSYTPNLDSSLASYKNFFIVVDNKYLVMNEKLNSISLWSYPNLKFQKRTQPFNNSIKFLFYLQDAQNNSKIIVITQENNYVYSFPQLQLLTSFGLTNCKLYYFNKDLNLIYLASNNSFQVFKSTDFALVNQISVQFSSLLFFEIYQNSYIIIQYFNADLQFFDLQGQFIFSYKHSYNKNVKISLCDNKLFILKSDTNQCFVIQINDIQTQDIQPLNLTFPSEIRSLIYIQQLDYLFINHLKGQLSIYQFSQMNLIEIAFPLQEKIETIIKLNNMQLILISETGKIGKLTKINPIQINNFANTSANKVTSFKYDLERNMLIIGRANGLLQIYDNDGMLMIEYRTTPYSMIYIYADFERNIIITVDQKFIPRKYQYPPYNIIDQTQIQNSGIQKMQIDKKSQVVCILKSNQQFDNTLQYYMSVIILKESNLDQIIFEGGCNNGTTNSILLNKTLNQLIILCNDSSIKVYSLESYSIIIEIPPIFSSSQIVNMQLELKSTTLSINFQNPSQLYFIDCTDWKTSQVVSIPNNFTIKEYSLNKQNNILLLSDQSQRIYSYDFLQQTVIGNITISASSIINIASATPNYFMYNFQLKDVQNEKHWYQIKIKVHSLKNFIHVYSYHKMSLYIKLEGLKFISIQIVEEIKMIIIMLFTGEIQFYQIPDLQLKKVLDNSSAGDFKFLYSRNSDYLITFSQKIKVISQTTGSIVSERQIESDIEEIVAYFNINILQIQYTFHVVEFIDLQSLITIQSIKFESPIVQSIANQSNGKIYFALDNGRLQVLNFNDILLNRLSQQYDGLIPNTHSLPTALFTKLKANSNFKVSQFFYYNYINYKLCSIRPTYQLQDNLGYLMEQGRPIQMHSVGRNLYLLMGSTLLIYQDIQIDDELNGGSNVNQNLYSSKLQIELKNCCKMIYYPVSGNFVIYQTENEDLVKVIFKDSQNIQEQTLYSGQNNFIEALFFESKTANNQSGYLWMIILENKKLIVFDLINNLQQSILLLLNTDLFSYAKISYNYEQLKQHQESDQLIFQKYTRYSEFTYPIEREYPLAYISILQSDGYIFQVNLNVFQTEGIPIKSSIQKKYLMYKTLQKTKFNQVFNILTYPEQYIIVVLSYGTVDIFQINLCTAVQKLIPPSQDNYKITVGLNAIILFNQIQMLFVGISDLLMLLVNSPDLQQINEIFILQDNLFLMEQSRQLTIFSINDKYIQQLTLEKGLEIYEDWNNINSVKLNIIDIHYMIQGTFLKVHSAEQQKDPINNRIIKIQLIANSLQSFFKGTITIQQGGLIQENIHLKDGYYKNICNYGIIQAKTYYDSKLIVSKIFQIQTENLKLTKTTQRIVYYFESLDTFAFIFDKVSASTTAIIRNTNTTEQQNYFFTPKERVQVYVSQRYAFKNPSMSYLIFQHVFFQFKNGSGFLVDSQSNVLQQIVLDDALVSQDMNQVSFIISNIDSVIIDGLILDGCYQYNILIEKQLSSDSDDQLTNQDTILIGFFNVTNIILNNIQIINYSQISSINPLLLFVDCKNVTMNGFSFQNNIIQKLNSIVQYINVTQVTIQNVLIQNNTVTQIQKQMLLLQPNYVSFQLNATQQITVSLVKFSNNTHLSFIEIINKYSLQGKESLFYDLICKISNSIFSQNQITKGIIRIQSISEVLLENLIFQKNRPQLTDQQLKQIQVVNSDKFNEILQIYKQYLILIQDIEISAMNNCQFIGNYILGAMAYFFASQFTINQFLCIFNGNLISSGGCLYIHMNNNLKISTINSIYNSVLLSNQVYRGEGGAIYLHTSDLNLVNTTISNNTALVGGGIKFVDLVPQFIYDRRVLIGGKYFVEQFLQDLPNQSGEGENTKPQLMSNINNNTAIIYGNNIGSVPTNMRVECSQNELSNFRSGSYLKQNIIVYLLDEEGNNLKISEKFMKIIKDSQLISFTIQILDYRDSLQSQSDPHQEYYPLLVNGKSIKDLDQFDTKQQAVLFNVSFTGHPLKSSKFVIKTSQTTLLDLQKRQFFIGSIEKSIPIQFRDCEIGEVPYFPTLNTYIECLECQQGKYNLQKVEVNDIKNHTCQTCPHTAEYCEKDYIKLMNGYWRDNFYSDEIYQCHKTPGHCVNNQSLPNYQFKNQVNYCIPGYIGKPLIECVYEFKQSYQTIGNPSQNRPLCMSCDELGKTWELRYNKISKFECTSESQHKAILLLGVIFSLILSVFVGIYTSYSLWRIRCCRVKYILKVTGIMMLNKSVRDLQSFFYIKISFIYYLLHFRIHQLNLADISNEELGIYFLTNPADIPAYYLYNLATKTLFIPLIYSKIIRCFFYPLFPLAVIFFTYELLIFIKKIERKKHFYINVLVIFYMMYHSSVIQFILMPLNCQRIGDDYKIAYDTQFSCFTPDHTKYLIILIVPLFTIVAIIIPSLITFKLFSIRKKLSLISSQNYLGIIYVEFKDSCYYWDIFRMIMSLIHCLMFDIIDGYFFLKGLMFTMAILFYLYMLLKNQPYQQKRLYLLDLHGHLVILIQFFFQVLILNITNSISQINNTTNFEKISIKLSKEFFLILFKKMIHLIFSLKLLYYILIDISLSDTIIGKFLYFYFKRIRPIIPQEFRSYYGPKINTQRVQQNWRMIKSRFDKKISIIQLQNNQTNNSHQASKLNSYLQIQRIDGQINISLNNIFN